MQAPAKEQEDEKELFASLKGTPPGTAGKPGHLPAGTLHMLLYVIHVVGRSCLVRSGCIPVVVAGRPPDETLEDNRTAPSTSGSKAHAGASR